MRILVYSLNFAPELTGIARYNTDFVDWLAGRGHQVRVVCAPPYYPQWKVGDGHAAGRYRRERRGLARVLRCPLWVPRRPTGGRRVLHHLSFAASSLPVVVGLAAVWRPHVVMVTEPPVLCAPGAVLAALLGGSLSWLHIQDLEADAAFGLGLLKGRRLRRAVVALEGWLMRHFGLVTTISQAMRDRVMTRGLAGRKVTLFPNWVDVAAIHPTAAVSPMRAELAIGPEQTVALYSGSLGGKQGAEIIVEAARHLRDRSDVHFVVCGDGSAKPGLEDMARDLDNLTFLPLQPEERLNALLNLADLHLLPQRADADGLVLPSKLIGMLASGRPVIASVAAGSEIAGLLSGGAGLAAPPGDARRLAEAIGRLADDSGARRRAGARARALAEQHFDRERILGAMLDRLEADCIRALR